MVKPHNLRKFICLLVIVLLLDTIQTAKAQHDPLQKFEGKIGKTLEETRQWWPKKLKAPEEAPNVVWILLDDVGFGASSAFGGLIETPTIDSLSDNGLRYTNFTNTGICAPTRAALLTGRNHHKVSMGHHPHLAVGTPGYNGNMPFEAGTMAEIMLENGYNTFAVGKWHLTKPEQISPAGPFNRWPTGRGFEQFYGFLGGSTDQWHPKLVEGINQINIEPNNKHFNELITDKAIEYISNQKSAAPDKPFFLYYAPGATHTPHQVASDWIEKYSGKFDRGWDYYRKEVFNRQQKMGLFPENTKLPSRQEGIRAWDSLSSDEKKVFARFMEVYAGFFSYTDYEIGRLVNFIKEIGQLDNTVIFVMLADNGASKEGTYVGRAGGGRGIDRDSHTGEGMPYLLGKLDELGSETTSPNFPLGWAQATNVPFQYWKSDAFSEGGTHGPLTIFYPKGIAERQKGSTRMQHHHVVDILPTTVDLTGIEIPKTINGYEQMPIQGKSMAYTLNDAETSSRRKVQYYELHGGRAIYKDGWKAAAIHPKTYTPRPDSGPDTRDINFRAPADFDQDKWVLYNIEEDWTETNDLSSKYPGKLEELQELFEREAIKNNVYPLKDFRTGMPKAKVKRKTILYGDSQSSFLVKIGNKPLTITANLTVEKPGNEGVIFSHGNRFDGTVLFIKGGKLYYTLNRRGKEITIESSQPVTVGDHVIKIEFQEARIDLFIDDIRIAAKDINNPNSYLKRMNKTGISVGQSMTSAISSIYKSPFKFTGKIQKVIIQQ